MNTQLHYNAQPNPFLGPLGTATMHGDAQASDCTPLPGPGAGPWDIQALNLGGACPTVLVGHDDFIQVLTTQRFGSDLTFLQPKISLLHPNGSLLSSLEIPKGALLGAVYAYIDHRNRMVVTDGTGTLIRVAHDASGSALYVDQRADLSSFLSQQPGDQIVGLTPDWSGRVWLASRNGRVAVMDENLREVRGITLNHFDPTGERVDNSISSAPEGVSVITNRGMYLLDWRSGRPEVVWSVGYDYGSHRKPGKLAYGSGASPTFFGPNGSDYLMLTDNGDIQESVVVYETATAKELGRAGLFMPFKSGSENSMIGIGHTIIAACTYGYPYPRYPEGAGPSMPAHDLFSPGFERWDLGARGLKQVWRREDIYSSAVPRYSAADGLIYTCERPRGPAGLANGITVNAVAIDIETGQTVYSQRLPGLVTLLGTDTLQMVGTIDSYGTWWQGTIGGIFRISRKGQ
ncbi:6-pyruvoyl tetrahydrobiopterin synthase [Corynebacterium sp. ES2794-CONJ1]|uniref:6-pyruvoyl tetrahydrobiopterin synthase n=1 Tax=Corynebacterium sp. ES2794-CONJ1 TaxID=2980553 RepID=UPI0021D9C5A0|nr:6-pyruvoyl tetrahydrobiopterin synthase [Corynebacterium sp. ES2794-CONJ1]MCU9519435.1 6-pyruvoyl tetrahydrobiopterin synthase [Corynebacterium sp. ES2794-CONJ1]